MSLSIRLATAMISLVLLTVGAVSLLSYYSLEAAILPRAQERIEGRVKLLASELEGYARGARDDILGFRSAVALEGMVRARLAGGTDPVDGAPEGAWRERMAARYLAELGSKASYDQFRIIGADGAEIVRVDRSGPDGTPRVVRDHELQPKADRGFFKATIALPPRAIYVSPVELNQEQGVIAEPHVPTLRVATPIHAPNGTVFGIVVINVDMRPIFERLHTLARGSRQVFVVNDKGDYLLHPVPAKAFAFEFGKQARWQDEFPELARAPISENGVVQLIRDAAGEQGVAALIYVRPAGGPQVGVIETVSNAVIMAPAASLRQSVLIAGAGAVLVAALVATLLARSLAKPLVQMTRALEGLPGDRPLVLPIGGSGEIGVLSRAFSRMATDVREKTAALNREISQRKRIFDTSLDLILVVDRQGTFVQVSPSCYAILGHRPQDMVGHSAIRFIHPSDLDSTREEMRAARRGKHMRNFGCRYVHADGREVMLEWTGVWSDADQQHYFIGRDVTTRNAAEAKLRQYAEKEQHFIAAVESSQDAIITKQLDGTITGWNHAAELLFGYSATEAIGQSIDLIVPDQRRDEVHDILRRVGHGERFDQYETVRTAKDGRRIDISLSVSPVKSPSGQIVGAAKVARDITARKRAAEALKRATDERQKIFEILSNTIASMTDAVLVADVEGNVIHSNPAAQRLMGITSGQTPAEWALPNEVRMPDGSEPVPLADRPLMRAVRGETVRNIEIVVRLKGVGKTQNLIANGGPIRDRTGQVTGGVVVYHDVTQTKETERQLRQAQKMEAVGELTGGVAHDFNNILTVITGTIEILAEAVADKPSLAGIAKMIDEAAGRGADLTQRLLAFARKQPLQPRQISINDLVIETVKLLKPTLGEYIEVEALLKDGVPEALVDPSQLTTSLLNLALNSRDAMPNGGRLLIETGQAELDEAYCKDNPEVQPGRYVMLAVSDTGTGIPAAIKEKVFEPFFTTKDVGRGTGLGLSMVYGFVKQTGGHIKIYSEEGQGTTIKIYLPPSLGQAETRDTTLTSDFEGGSEAILVVEDDDLVRTYVVTQLRSLGYTVLTAANAVEGLAEIDSGKHIDVLFTDVIMPGSMNGRQLADAAKVKRPSLGILYTSGYSENAIVHHGRLDPGVLLLAKPYRKADLARMIRKAIAAAPVNAGAKA
jgi:PAS domain S-box-containing protein